MARKAIMKSGWGEFRRFEATLRNDMWQGDVQYTLNLPHPDKPGKKRWLIWLYTSTIIPGSLYAASSTSKSMHLVMRI